MRALAAETNLVSQSGMDLAHASPAESPVICGPTYNRYMNFVLCDRASSSEHTLRRLVDRVPRVMTTERTGMEDNDGLVSGFAGRLGQIETSASAGLEEVAWSPDE